MHGRVISLNHTLAGGGGPVVYWMQASQRAVCNHALEHSISRANELGRALSVLFVIDPRYPKANMRSYRFMLEGLEVTRELLKERGIGLSVHLGPMASTVIDATDDAAMLVTDRGYLRDQVRWREEVADAVGCPMEQVETDVIVPVEMASNKSEYSAATLRRKLLPQIAERLVMPPKLRTKVPSLEHSLGGVEWDDHEGLMDMLHPPLDMPGPGRFRGGTSEGLRRFDGFLAHSLDRYHQARNDPAEECMSHMSPYLHFGQVSPLQLAIAANAVGGDGAEAFLEELIIRRELAINLVRYDPGYDAMDCLPGWAAKTLSEHEDDHREYLYDLEELESAATHDPYWNAAQMEMVATGKMHGYMRMYWGKKILEWSETVRGAYDAAIHLNDMYELDGRDPNGYAGVAWCFGKHDRAWGERFIFGKVRYMSSGGLERKFDMRAYLDRVEGLVGDA